MRRIRRHIPDAKFIAAFWNLRDGGDDVAQTMDCEVVTQLEKAVERIMAACSGTISDGRSVQHPPVGAEETPRDSATCREESSFRPGLAERVP